MSVRPTLTSEEYLINAPLPEATETYTVIPHSMVISETKLALSNYGYEIVSELYRCNQDAQVAQGVYHIKYSTDDDLGLLFAWSNSYDKSMRFRCSVGAYMHQSLSSIIPGNIEVWDRKHTGDADTQVKATIEAQIENAIGVYEDLVKAKDKMKSIPVDTHTRAELIGRFYLLNEVITSEQISTIKGEIKKPTYVVEPENSLWDLYTKVIFALQKSHPKNWMEQQRMVHYLVCREFQIDEPEVADLAEDEQDSSSTEEIPVVDPNQRTVEQEIEERAPELGIPTTIDTGETKPTMVEEFEAQDKVAEDIHEAASKQAVAYTAGVDPVTEDTPVTLLKNETQTDGSVITTNVTPSDETPFKDEPVGDPLQQAETDIKADIQPDENLSSFDDTWNCLSCGKVQGPNDIFHDGQLCSTCAEKD